MLLQHAWLAPLVKPETITEEDEEAAEAAAADGGPMEQGKGILNPELEDEAGFVDREVGEWVIEAIEKKKRGVLGQHAKPALHAAPLDGMGQGKSEAKPVAVDA